ncbi:MAG: Gfo/Idh/MocA family oxidoreductase [Rhodospirillales bacterium]|nr:Gfo/Idh/MocA family oxidoreductase [Rhodospirillales bacterium]
MNSIIRVVVIGLGVQGHKRQAVSGDAVVAVVDSVNPNADYKSITDVNLNDYDAALVCTPDEAKIELLTYLLGNGKHVLVEKPMLTETDEEIEMLRKLALEKEVVCYTAYNHRFEPHFVKMKELIESDQLGKIYSLRMFYGNGTARLVRNSAWRDQAAGVLPDLGSHLLDTLRFWLGDDLDIKFEIRSANCHENRSFDHVVIGSNDGPAVQLEMNMLSWRNHFTCDIYAEKGSAHIESLCKWGPSTFIHRTRVLPAGRPPEVSQTLVQPDPTWDAEYAHFIDLCDSRGQGNLSNDIWLNRTLRELAQQAGVEKILPEKP